MPESIPGEKKDGVNLSIMQKRDPALKQEELRIMWIRFAVAVFFVIPLLYLAMALMIPGLLLPVLDVLNPVNNPENYALAQLVSVLPIIALSWRLYANAFMSLIRRNPNMSVPVALGSTLAFLFSSYQVVLVLLGNSASVYSLHFDIAGVIIALMLLGKALAPYVEVGPDTTLAQVIKLAEEDRKAKDSEKPADFIVRHFVPIVCTIALVVAALWFLATTVGDFELPSGKSPAEFSLLIAVTVLVIASPGAFVLAGLAPSMTSIGKVAELGILVKNRKSFEALCELDRIFLDMSGTVLTGKPSLIDIIPVATARPEDALAARDTGTVSHPSTADSSAARVSSSLKLDDFDRALFELVGNDSAMSNMVGWQKDRLLTLVASVEKNSEHPLGRALVEAAEKHDLPLTPVDSFTAFPGLGIAATVSGQDVLVGNRKFMEQNAIDIRSVASITEGLAEAGKTPLFVSSDRLPIGIVTLADTLKPTSPAAIRRLQDAGLEITLLTGDNLRTAQSIAAKLGIDNLLAEVLPQEKAEEVSRQQKLGKKVAMVGDGINDALAMTRADVGIAVGTGTDVAIESADIVLTRSDLMDVCKAIDLSKHTMRVIKQNLFWAFAYNVVGIPVAAGLLFLFGGPLLNPIIAAACMSLSSVSVVFNALRLRRYRFE